MIVRLLTKPYRYALLIAVFSFLSIGSSFAQVTWIGGNANWNDPANWDTGSVPTATDDVVLPSNIITIPSGYLAAAESVEVQGSATLVVNATASLTIENAASTAGLTVDGRASINGSLVVLNTINTRAISVKGKFIVGSTGTVTIDQAYYGIYVYSPGIVSSKGYMSITNIDAACVFNKSAFYNKGTMDLTSGTSAGQAAIANFKKFYNFSSGAINTEGGGNSTIINNSGGIMVNHGDLDLNNAGNGGVTTSGVFYNYYSGDIDISNAGYKGIYVYSSGSFYNYGNAASTSSPNGMLNYGYVKNTGLLNLIGTTGYAYRDWTTATLENDDLIYLQTTGSYSASINGQFTNQDGGNIFIYKKCFLNSSATVENHGFITSDYSSLHYKHAAATLVNHRMINDIHGSFGSTIDNQQVVTQPLTAAMQNGVAFANPIDVFSLSNVTIASSWFTAPGSPIAGTYDSATNEFLPNATSIGATELRVSITNNTTGSSYLATVKLSTPILPFVANQNFDHQEHNDRNLVSSDAVTIFPNPSFGQFEIASTLFEKGDRKLAVYSNLGQLVYEKQFAKYDSPQVVLPAALGNGQYVVRLIGSDGEVSTASLQLIR